MTTSSPLRYSVGFVAPELPRARLLGSGTLVSVGSLHGVLTAAHVLDNLRTFEEVGFYECTIRPAQMTGLRLPTAAVDAARIGNRLANGLGPDLAFLRLPDQTVAALKGNSSFLMLEREAELSNSSPPDGAHHLDSVIGAIDEWTADAPMGSVGLDMGIISVLMNQGNVHEITGHDGYDRNGGKLLQAIFPQIDSEYEIELVKLAHSSDRADVDFVLSVLRSYRGGLFLQTICKELIAVLPEDDKRLDQIEIVLQSTGIVSGEFGMVEAYQRKKSEVDEWLQDSRLRVREFAERYRRSLDRSIAVEQRRSEANHEMRRLGWPEEE